jgi:hypothetical protein
MQVHLVVRGIYDLRSVGNSTSPRSSAQKASLLLSFIQGVIESCTDILTTSYSIHVELGKNIKKILCQKIK